MKLGIFHKVFARSMLEESLDGVQAAGLEPLGLDTYLSITLYGVF